MPARVAFRAEMRATLLQSLAAGATYRDATAAAGIPWRTWCDWSKAHSAGGHSDPDVDSLVADARKAYAKASVAMTATVSVASKKDWRAAAFVLQHRQGDPKARHDEKRARYEAEVAKNRAAGTHVETVRHVGELTDDELRAEAQRILRGDADADKPRTTH